MEKEAVRYHLHRETVKKSQCATDDVFRIFSLSTEQLHTASDLANLGRTSAPGDTKEGASYLFNSLTSD
jgi:hypothetical protein